MEKFEFVRKEFFKYFFSSGLAFVLDYSILYLAVDGLGWNYLIGASLGFSFGIVCIYFLSTRWVFDARSCNDRCREFYIFTFIGIVGLIVNLSVLFVCTSVLGFYYLWSKIWSVAVVFSFNFGMRKYILFREL